jgi:hypothetical protein
MGVLLLVIVVFAANTANAQSRYIQREQHYRIQQGVRHGQLTRNEARQLKMQQRNIKRMKRIAMANGYVSPIEKARIRNAERRAERNIYIQKHDRQRKF